jgi:hypothetical protein
MPTSEVIQLAAQIKKLNDRFTDLDQRIRDEKPLPLPDTDPSEPDQ